MDTEKVIKGLEFTKAMILFNPSTGEDKEPENLNEADKTTYDACVGAIALLKEQEQKIEHLKEVIKTADFTLDMVKDRLIALLERCRPIDNHTTGEL